MKTNPNQLRWEKKTIASLSEVISYLICKGSWMFDYHPSDLSVIFRYNLLKHKLSLKGEKGIYNLAFKLENKV